MTQENRQYAPMRFYPFHAPTIEGNRWIMGMANFQNDREALDDFEHRYNTLRLNFNDPSIYEAIGQRVISELANMPHAKVIQILLNPYESDAKKWLRGLCVSEVDGTPKSEAQDAHDANLQILKDRGHI